MNGNQILKIHNGAFTHFFFLQHLGLGDNQISKIPDGVFAGLSNLQKLFLSGNQISEIPGGAFRGLHNLQTLDLAGNQISEIPDGAFTDLTNLQHLGLGDNQISEIHEGAFNRSYSLQILHLGGNHLSTLDSNIFLHIPRPLVLNLHVPSSDNPWDCETMCWLKKEEENGTIQFWSTPKYVAGDWSSWDCPCKGECGLLSVILCLRGIAHGNTFLLKLLLFCNYSAMCTECFQI